MTDFDLIVQRGRMGRRELRALFPDAADRRIAMAVANTLRQSGISEPDIAKWLTIGRDANDRIGAGFFADQGAMLDFVARQAENAGLDNAQILAVAEAPMFARDYAGNPILPPEPDAGMDAATIKDAERRLADGTYKHDSTLAQRYSDALDRMQERAAAGSDKPPSEEAEQREALAGAMREVEATMYDEATGRPNPAYWSGGGAETYRALIEASQPAAAGGEQEHQ